MSGLSRCFLPDKITGREKRHLYLVWTSLLLAASIPTLIRGISTSLLLNILPSGTPTTKALSSVHDH